MAPINLSNIFRRKQHSEDITQYYITSPPNQTEHALLSVPTPRPNTPIPIPPSSLLFSLTHPPIQPSSATAFFLHCLPDPIGFLYHSSYLIHSYLSLDTERVRDIQWRHQLIHLVLKDEPGLAATSGGKIVISLQWIGGIMHAVQKGDKKVEDATKEFKGVLLHELVHTIQHDGRSTTPGWLIESIADYVRLHAKLDPPHWRKPGQGKREKGWEEAYDVGARFLTWLVGESERGAFATSDTSANASPRTSAERVGGITYDHLSLEPLSTTVTATAAQATATRYPTPPSTAIPSEYQSPSIAPPNRHRKRPGPYPELIKLIDTRLTHDKWSDDWWMEMTGMTLDRLWDHYLDYYSVSESNTT